MTNSVLEAAVLPFHIIESLGVPCGYERSFKLSNNSILSNRYLLGINTAEVSHKQLLEACRQLSMPEELFEQFQDGLRDANLVFLGFEADLHGGALFKVYLEYWDQLQKKLHRTPVINGPHLLHKGFKWQYDRPEKNLVTEYICLPGLPTADIRQLIDANYINVPAPNCLESINKIIDVAQAKAPGDRFIYEEVSEPGNSRKSFDINLYSGGLKMHEIASLLNQVVEILDIDRAKFERLMSIVADKLFGHISAGISRDGDEYMTLYYEN